MKHSLLFLSLLSLLFLGSCSGDDTLTELIQEPEPKVPTIPFMGTITSGNEPSAVAQALVADDGPFYALSDQGSTLKATWTVGDEMALIVSNKLYKAKVTEVFDRKAIISADVPATVSDGADARFIYPYSAVDSKTLEVKTDLLSVQDGKLATIAKNLDVCEGSGKLSVVGGNAGLKADVALKEQFSIMRLTTKYNNKDLKISKLTIKHGSNNYTINLSSEASSGIYIALKPASTTCNIVAFPANGARYLKDYTKVTLAAQKFYPSTLNLDFDEFWFLWDTYYMWDAKEWYWYGKTTYPTQFGQNSTGYPTYEDTDRWHNVTYGHYTSYSAKDMPTMAAVTWYLHENRYYDETTTWYLGGEAHTGGVWFKKWEKISGKPSGTTIFNCVTATTTYGEQINGKPSNTADYFFLPAMGRYFNGTLVKTSDNSDNPEVCYWCSVVGPISAGTIAVNSLVMNKTQIIPINQAPVPYCGMVAGHRPDGSNWFK